MEFDYGVPQEVAPNIRRLVCNNPSPLTGPGTNTYLIGRDRVTVIDPGPNDPVHIAAILAAAPRMERILVTHSHLDHSPAATPLAAATGAPICAFGPSGAGLSDVMAPLSGLGGGEGVDAAFTPTEYLADGATIDVDGASLTAHHTPGHFGNHMTFELGDICFSGDLVMGWATTLISPPHGDLTDFMVSCRALLARAPALLLPGHGAPVTTPAERIAWLIAHRLEREAQIIAQLATGPQTAAQLTARIYTDVPAHLWPAAERNVLAHLIDLTGQSKAAHHGPLTAASQFELR